MTWGIPRSTISWELADLRLTMLTTGGVSLVLALGPFCALARWLHDMHQYRNRISEKTHSR
jgi:hypothetical protein